MARVPLKVELSHTGNPFMIPLRQIKESNSITSSALLGPAPAAMTKLRHTDVHNPTITLQDRRGRNKIIISRCLLRRMLKAVLTTRDMKMTRLPRQMTLRRKTRRLSITATMSSRSLSSSEAMQSRIISMLTTQHNHSGLSMEAIESAG